MNKWTAITAIACGGFASTAYAATSNENVAAFLGLITFGTAVIGLLAALLSD